MDAIAQGRTKLEALLFEKKLSETAAAAKCGIPQKTFNDKIHRRTQFNISEMRAIQTNLFPDMTLEEIFEGYGE